jgi:hypothetical protein
MEQESIWLQTEARLKRLGGETRLIFRDGMPEPLAHQSDPGLAEAMAQAHLWQRALAVPFR